MHLIHGLILTDSPSLGLTTATPWKLVCQVCPNHRQGRENHRCILACSPESFRMCTRGRRKHAPLCPGMSCWCTVPWHRQAHHGHGTKRQGKDTTGLEISDRNFITIRVSTRMAPPSTVWVSFAHSEHLNTIHRSGTSVGLCLLHRCCRLTVTTQIR
ncbi:hypothetical protein BC629DRAFT_192887 [Irpex lacteus]|nr:hypothetical protein BC629DRAFT_192887 [Irpex lacteus]